MTSEHISRRTALVGSFSTVVAGSLALSGCGGGGDGGGGGNAQLRAINLTSDLPSVDLVTNDTVAFSALTAETLVAYRSVEAKEWTLRVRRAGDAASLFSGSFNLGKDQNFTAVIWGRETSLRLSTLPENENNDSITAGNVRVRMFNATTDSGAVDVFFTSETAQLGETAPTQGAVGAGNLSGFRDLSAGTYRLRVTGVGDPNDVRLDVSGVVLPARQHLTLVLTAGTSGVLMNGQLIQQQGSATALRNNRARVRVVAGVDSAGVLGISVAGTTLVGALRSPSVGPYQLVAGGSQAVQVRVNGGVVSEGTQNFVAGNDYTLMVFGNPASPQIRLIVDDNRLPSATNRVKLRLVHGAAGVDPITLSVDFLAVATDITFGNASAYGNIASGNGLRVDVTSASASGPLFLAESTNLAGQAVYTTFLLGGNATPTGVLRRER